LRVLHVIVSVDPTGGGPIEGIIRQHSALGGDGRREIVSLDLPDAPFLNEFPLPVHAIGTPKNKFIRNTKLGRFGYSPHLVPWLRRNGSNYDVIVVNGLWNYAAVGSSRVLPLLGVPYFVFSHGMLDPWFRRTHPLKHIIKQLSWFLFEGRLLRGAEAVLFTSDEERRLARGEFLGHPYRSKVVRYGTEAPPPITEIQRAAFHAKVPALGGHPYLLFMSRIDPKKGCDLLIEAFANCARDIPDLHIVIAGPDRDGLKRKLIFQAQALGVDSRIHWPGMLSGDEKWGGVRGSEAFILPSHQENFGIVVAEAMACSIPVLITDKVNIWREIKTGKAGLVVGDNVAGVEGQIRQFFNLSPEDRFRMKSAALDTFQKHFDLANGAQSLQELFRGIIVAK
jgi:glycosyltransferase involved in cell wall biosynthesis